MTPTYDTDAPGNRVRLTARGGAFTLATLRELVRMADAVNMPDDAPVTVEHRRLRREHVRTVQVTRP